MQAAEKIKFGMFLYNSIYLDDPPRAGRAIDIWIPENPRQSFALCFIHGGGWRQGNREQMHLLMHEFYRLGYVCIATDYRLSGVDVVDQVSDVFDGMIVAKKFLKKAGIANDLVLYGSSAGGHLALLAGLAAKSLLNLKTDAAFVSGIVVSCAPVTFEPWSEIFPSVWKSMQEAAGVPHAENPDLYRRLSPANYFEGYLPPLMFVMAEYEHMFPNSITLGEIEKLRSGENIIRFHIYKNAEHGFLYAADRKVQRQALGDIVNFVNGIGRHNKMLRRDPLETSCL